MAPKKESTRSVEERNQLIIQWIPLVHSRVRRLRQNFPMLKRMTYDDCVSAGSDGLVRAAELFDPTRISERTNKPVQFNTYATRAIDQHIYREYARLNPLGGMKSHLEAKFHKEEENDPFKKEAVKPFKSLDSRYSCHQGRSYYALRSKNFMDEDLIFHPQDKHPESWEIVNHNMRMEELEEGLNKIFPRYATAIRKKFLEFKTLEVVGQEMNICKERVRQLIRDGIVMLRKACGVREYQGKICSKCTKQLDPKCVFRTCDSCRKTNRKASRVNYYKSKGK